MISSNNNDYNEAYVWIWLPGKTEPVVAGKLSASGDTLTFNYGQSYLARENAIAIYAPELPLKPGVLPLLPGMSMPSSIRDASPDAWGRRIIINKRLGNQKSGKYITELSELSYLLDSNSDRIGALDFQRSPISYEPRNLLQASLSELLEAADRVEKGLSLTPELDLALNHGTSIGGARPKAILDEKGKKYIAKFSTSTDLYSVVKAEFIAMRLAHLAGLNVAQVSLAKAALKDLLLIERFDRNHSKDGWQRQAMVSALTMLELDEMMARYASYEKLAEIIRFRFKDAVSTLRELFGRIIFNILSGNTDDHARNHAAFWDGSMLSLTPAYDICPQYRTGSVASQAMIINGQERLSKMSICLDAAPNFLLSEKEAMEIIERQIIVIGTSWQSVIAEAELSEVDQKLMWGRQFLNPFAFDDLMGERARLKKLASDFL